jgi:hypothetical protein
VILKRGQHSKYLPFVFTEQGVAMLSSVLKSERAVHVNIQIMRAFIKMRQMFISHEDLKQKIIAMERKYDKQFQIVFEAIKQLLEQDEKPKRKIDAKWFQSLRSGSRARRPANWKRSVHVVREYFNSRDNAAIGL